VGVHDGGFPDAALTTALAASGLARESIAEFVTSEDGIADCLRVDHHRAHAATAFLTSPFTHATIVVCDTHTGRHLSVWQGDGTRLDERPIEWPGSSFASVYSRLTALLGFEAAQEEARVEALARLRLHDGPGRAADLLRLTADGIDEAPGFEAYVRDGAGSVNEAAAVAAGVQVRLGELLIEWLRRAVGTVDRLCLGGGFFYNTYYTTLVRQSGIARDVFVPVNPGNPGVSAGCALARAVDSGVIASHPGLASPFLGPEYSSAEIKATLDNCKLSYAFHDDSALVRTAVEALARGGLVGWFRGRLEWGTRALGNRSILANARSPYVLENLNRYLKHREVYRTYGVTVCEEDAPTWFDGPDRSPYMEYEYALRAGGGLGHLCPSGTDRLRVQTLGADDSILRQLIQAAGPATGVPLVVNTSFNGFHEPIVCSPRDAVRVFYGSGLDLLVVGNFVLRK
jgi:carbamoyltransferase